MPSDLFSSLLSLRSKLVYAGGVCGRWAIDHNSDTAVWLHLVTSGRGWVHYPTKAQPVAFEAGDVVVFLPHAQKHYLSYSPHELVFDYPDARKARFDEGTTGFVCALIELGLPRAGLWHALPPEIFVRKSEADGILADLIRHTIAEAHQQRFGSFSVIERLCDNVFVLIVRHCIERGLLQEGVFAAMQDRRVETVLSLIHREPWLPWTVATLSAHAGLSRTVLTDKFTKMMGCPPGEYLNRWRMQTAANLLKESGLPVEGIAERCGYASVSAFTRAFKQSFGVSPGAYRRDRSAG
jgi:AraC-like DNA-binding protein